MEGRGALGTRTGTLSIEMVSMLKIVLKSAAEDPLLPEPAALHSGFLRGPLQVTHNPLSSL